MNASLIGLLVTAWISAAPTTTVIVVRHAEKGTSPAADPALSAAGAQRATLLTKTLHERPITAVLSTNYTRTRATAAPLAAYFKLKIDLVDALAADHARKVADGVLQRHRGQTVVVVGHSNTVPEIVAALGAPKPVAICEGEFDNLFIVQIPATGPATVEHLKYGAKTKDSSCRPN